MYVEKKEKRGINSRLHEDFRKRPGGGEPTEFGHVLKRGVMVL